MALEILQPKGEAVIHTQSVVQETAFARDSRIVHDDLIRALEGVALICRAGYNGSAETLIDYVEAKKYINEKLDAMIELLELEPKK